MKNPQGFVLAWILGLMVAAMAAFAVWFTSNPPAQEPVACTMEAKLCPDGSYVGRTGPKCEFTPCPSVATTSQGGTGGSGEGILPYNSGITGSVMLGPTCPVMRNPPDPQCADKPYATLVAIYHASDPAHPFVLVRSSADGTFKASLPPGDYTVGAGESKLPRCNITPATVQPKGYTNITVSCDTGIR